MKRHPRVGVEPFTTEGTGGSWTVRWRIRNDGDQPIRLLSAQHPHSQFRTAETRIDRDVPSGSDTTIALPVQFIESPGVRVENPFLILLFRESAEWRLLARVRVTAGTSGEPIASQAVVVNVQEVRRP
ncbi:MAG: hypothetical protein M3T56_09915 [Chloroflexota bacterium]|nr:hypothetical protein [Chloroflexota bacterium]